MTKDIYNFKRKEIKYLITNDTKETLLSKIKDHLILDSHGISKISSLYLDTDSFLLIRNSMEGKVYKEKLRIRAYNEISNNSKVFFEIKKKYKRIVYKRRIKCTYQQALDYIYNDIKPCNSQIMDEINYAMKFYDYPKPSFLISYIREAYYDLENDNLRITFDSKVNYQTNHLDLTKNKMGKQILDDHMFIMEIKVDGAMPLWLVKVLDELKIRPCSYSKYKNSYLDYIK